MQIYEKIVKYNSISELNFRAKKTPKMPYEKKRILQLFFMIILIKLSTSLQCQKGLNETLVTRPTKQKIL